MARAEQTMHNDSANSQ